MCFNVGSHFLFHCLCRNKEADKLWTNTLWREGSFHVHFPIHGTPYETTAHSLDHSPPVALEAELQLLQDPAALLQLRSVSIWEGRVVNCEASLLVDVQQGGNPVLVKLPSGAENKHFLHSLILEHLCLQEKEN